MPSPSRVRLNSSCRTIPQPATRKPLLPLTTSRYREATDGDAEAPTAGEGKDATADTTESKNAVQSDKNTSVEQDSQAQATGTGAKEKKDGKKATNPKNTKAASDYSLNYSDEQKKELERVTRVGDAEIKRVREDPRFPTIPFGDNTMINLKGAALNGVSFKTPEVNRKHGKDEASTGESLMKYGPQHPFIVITEQMAEAVKFIDGRALTEASGNITLERLPSLRDLGLDYVSSGALTHSATAIDIGLHIQ